MHAADAGGRAAVGLDGGGVVVGFDLDADGVGVVERDDAGVVDKDAHAPVVVRGVLHEVVRGGGDGLLEQVVDDDRAVGLNVVAGLVAEEGEGIVGGIGAVLVFGLIPSFAASERAWGGVSAGLLFAGV